MSESKIDRKRILSYFKILSNISMSSRCAKSDEKNKDEIEVIASLIKEEFEKEKTDLVNQCEIVNELLKNSKLLINSSYKNVFLTNSIYFPSSFSNDVLDSIFKQFEYSKNKLVFEKEIIKVLSDGSNFINININKKQMNDIYPIIENNNLHKKILNIDTLLNFYNKKCDGIEVLYKKDSLSDDENNFVILSFIRNKSKKHGSFLELIENDKLNFNALGDVKNIVLSHFKSKMRRNSSEKVYNILKPVLGYETYNFKSSISLVPKSCHLDYSNFLLNKKQSENILNTFTYEYGIKRLMAEIKEIKPLYDFLNNIYQKQLIVLNNLNLEKKYFTKSNFKYKGLNISQEINNILLGDKIKKMLDVEIDKKQIKKRKM